MAHFLSDEVDDAIDDRVQHQQDHIELHHSSLLDVGRYLLLDIVKDWFGIEQLCMLDTAFCHHKSRVKYLSYLSSKIVTFHGLQSTCVSVSFLKWIHKKNIEIEDMKINNSVLHSLKEFNHLISVKSIAMSGCTNDNIPNLHKVLSMYNNLERIELSHSLHMSDELLASIALNCRKLKSFIAESLSQITSAPIKAIAEQCHELTDISLIKCDLISDSAVDALSVHCKSLKSIDLSNCALITDDSLVFIGTECLQLTHLNVSNCAHISGYSVRLVTENCKLLTSLLFTGCTAALTDHTLLGVAHNAPQLTRLHFGGALKLTDSAVTALCASCTKLKDVDFSDSHLLTIESVKAVAGLRHLQRVAFRLDHLHVHSRDESFVLLAEGFSTLTEVDLVNCVLVGERAHLPEKVVTTSAAPVIGEVAATPADVSVTPMNVFFKMAATAASAPVAVHYNYVGEPHPVSAVVDEVQDRSLLSVLPKCVKTLRSVTFHAHLRNGTVTATVSQCPELRVLRLSAETDDAVLSCVASHCKQLTELHITGSSKVTDAGVCAVLSSNKLLLSLDVSGCVHLTDASVLAIAANCRRLKFLTAVQCRHFTDSSIGTLSTHCPQLASIDLRGCPHITTAASEKMLREHCASLTEIHIGTI